jgi:phosphatidylethanolamine-binding protein (PEBP) family uncharacterized protein
LYALDVPNVALANGTREELDASIREHVLGSARLAGRYRRQQGKR